MTVIRKREGDKGGCCNPYSELQLEIERVDQTAIDAKTTANNAEATVNANIGKVNEAIAIVPQVQTNTENIAVHQGWLSANTTDINKNASKLKEQEKDITALKTKTNDNAAAIEAIENEVGSETTAGTIQYRLKDIDTKLPTAIKEVEMIADASTVTHKATHISGTAESDALPVVSREQAGIMSASVYAAMEDVIANNTSRISVLEQSAPTYDITGLVGPNPTNAEISTAFQQKYPNVPIQSGLRAADYDNAHFWQYGKNTWIMLTQIDVQVATNQSLGIVKGSNTNGKIFIETDGSMSLKGYDALVSKDATHDSKIGTLETGLGDANARIDAINTNVANNAQDIIAANGNISTNTNDINGLKGRMATAEGQIATHETKINQHTQSINGLTTDVNGLKTDVNGLKTDVNGLSTDVNDLKDRMATAEGQIATHETKILTLEADMSNIKPRVGQLESDIGALETNVTALDTTKQDKLTAGDNITINNNVISANTFQPILRIVEGRNNILNEFKDFIHKGEIGDSFEIICRFPKDNRNGYGPYVDNPFFKFGGDSSNRFSIYPTSKMIIVNRILNGSNYEITAAFHGFIDYSGSESGLIYLTSWGEGSYTFRVYPYSYMKNVYQDIGNGPIELGMSDYDILYNEKAYVNYDPKP